MPVCEKCWADAYIYELGIVVDYNMMSTLNCLKNEKITPVAKQSKREKRSIFLKEKERQQIQDLNLNYHKED